MLVINTDAISQVINDEINAKIDSIITNYYESGRFSGSLLVAHNGSIIFQSYYGMSNKERGRSINTESIFGIASVSKIFTSSALMKLVEEKKVSISDNIVDYFPELPEAYKPVTIEHLLTHTSGIPDFLEKPVSEVSNDDVYRYLRRLKELEFIPGERYKYSNSGFILLAMIIEKVSGSSYPDFLTKRFFKPLKMKSTFVGRTGARKEKRIVTSYHMDGHVDDRPNYYYGPGGIYSTVDDLLKWDNSFFGGEVLEKSIMDKVLKPCMLADGSITNYGLGWGVLRLENETIAGHTGGMYGFRSIYEHDINSGITLIMLTNIGDSCPTMEIRNSIIGLFNSL